MLNTILKLSFLLLASLSVSAALGIFICSSAIHSLFFLVVVFVSAGLILFFIGAEFFGVCVIIIYVGAIAILFLFVLMMLDIRVLTVQTFKFVRSLWALFFTLLSVYLLMFFLSGILDYQSSVLDWSANCADIGYMSFLVDSALVINDPYHKIAAKIYEEVFLQNTEFLDASNPAIKKTPGTILEIVPIPTPFTKFFFNILDFVAIGNYMYTEFLVPFLLIGLILLIPLLSVVLVVLDKSELYSRKNNLLNRRNLCGK